MSRQRFALAALLIASVAVTPLLAQELTGDSVLHALLNEIRLLRTSMQKNSAYEIRGRLLIDRARMHQEVIRELSRELEGSADVMQPMEVDSFETDTTMVEANMEARAATLPDPDERRRMIEREKAAMAKRREMHMRHREQMRQRYQRMEARLAEEKEKLAAIEAELDRIHAELTAPLTVNR